MSASPRFWLRVGESPFGPFSIQQINEQLVAGSINWQTPSCKVGENDWRPLHSQFEESPQATAAFSKTNPDASNSTTRPNSLPAATESTQINEPVAQPNPIPAAAATKPAVHAGTCGD